MGRVLLNLADLPADLETPAFIYDERAVLRLLAYGQRLRAASGCKVLYSLKPLPFPDLLELMTPRLDGFAASSLFEARLARGVMDGRAAGGGREGQKALHITTPGLRPGEAAEIGDLCDYLSFNSLSQWERHRGELAGRVSCGLRVNPGLSFLEDERYDPCRPDSKLGAPLEKVVELVANRPGELAGLEGALIHSNCEATDYRELETTVTRLHREIPGLLRRVRWINLGGGYLFGGGIDLTPLHRAVRLLQGQYGLEVFIEPGAAFIRSAGYIVATALDLFANGDKTIAILDTTINHIPEALEFDFEPDVAGHREQGRYGYVLAGGTCLAGDVFGEYRFEQPLAVGDRVLFYNAGAYTLAKAHTFNGVNLPTIYALDESGRPELKRRFTYADYAARWGAYAANPV